MSRPRSPQSPHYRKFPWEEPGFDLHKVLAELDDGPSDRSRRLRKDLDEHWDHCRDGGYPEGPRRASPFPEDRHLGHPRHPDQEEFYHRKLPPPPYEARGFDEHRMSQPRSGGADGGRGAFREHSFENRGRSPHSPLRLARERLPQAPRSQHEEHPHREPGTGWRREEQGGRGRGRFRGPSPGGRTDEQRGGTGRERGRRNPQGPVRDRRREDPHPERSPPYKRQRRETDGANHPGFRDEEDFGPGGGFGGGAQGGRVRPLVIEHDHGISERRPPPPPRWDPPDGRPARQRSPRPSGFRPADDRQDPRGRRFEERWREPGYPEPRRSPAPQDRPAAARYGPRDSVGHKGRGGPRPLRGRPHRGRMGPPRSQTPGSYQDASREEPRPGGGRPPREDRFEDPGQGEPSWAGEDRLRPWGRDGPGSSGRRPPPLPPPLPPPRDDPDPKMPRQRERGGWSDGTPDRDETLTIKVDMSRPVTHSSSLCYSSDRQLSLDLVNVGRQRLDFLPMLEHSGTYRETASHTGTFAQEIITLVHHVREQYFVDGGVTLNERFSRPQKADFSEEEEEEEEEEEPEELTLDERFSSNRGFSLNTNSLDDEDELLFSRLGPMQGLSPQPVRGPGDLRHDLERRRQERLEGVKVTIPGKSRSHGARGPPSEYSDPDLEAEVEVVWPEDPGNRRQEAVPRRGGSFRLNSGSQRRNHRFPHRVGPTRRPNTRSTSGPSW